MLLYGNNPNQAVLNVSQIKYQKSEVILILIWKTTTQAHSKPTFI